MTALQLPEGFTVRKVGNALKVVPMRKRKAVIVEAKQMLKAVRSEAKGYGFDWLESLKDTVLANRESVFTADEMYAALESVCKSGEDLDSKKRVTSYLDHMVEFVMSPMRLSKVGESYKLRHAD